MGRQPANQDSQQVLYQHPYLYIVVEEFYLLLGTNWQYQYQPIATPHNYFVNRGQVGCT
jgi:hypothetical protein